MIKQTEVSHFLVTLHGLLDDPESQQIICWSEDGLQVVINDLARLFSEVLPVYFEQKNPHSFVRQLNMYDFKKLRQQQNRYLAIYEHPLFQRG